MRSLGVAAHTGWPAGCLILAIVFIIAAETYFWVIMLVLVILLGTDHPPTADDDCRMGLRSSGDRLVLAADPDFVFPAVGHYADWAVDRWAGYAFNRDQWSRLYSCVAGRRVRRMLPMLSIFRSRSSKIR